MVNPFPLSRERAGGRANAHHNPMEPFRNERVGLYRPRVAQRIPRAIPDELFNRAFAELGSHRDRALVALWVSTGARAAELLGVRCGDVDPGQQLITVIRKGTRALQQVPASPDAFVWLRLYESGRDPAVPTGRDDPLWWTRRRPFRPLTYHAARAMFGRAAAALGANWTLHDLRHTAAYRMARDPQLPLTDVQWVLGHAHLSTTQLYLTRPRPPPRGRGPGRRDGSSTDTATGSGAQPRRCSTPNTPAAPSARSPSRSGSAPNPAGVAAGGHACPFRFRAAGRHFRTDVSYLPDLHAYLDDLLRNRERLLATSGRDDWARTEATPSEQEISKIRRLIARISTGLDELSSDERERVEQAVTLVRRHRTVTLGMPQVHPALPDLRPERTP